MASQANYRSYDPTAKEKVVEALQEMIAELSVDLRVDSDVSFNHDTREGIKEYFDHEISPEELDEMVAKARDKSTERLGAINSRITQVKELIALLDRETVLQETATQIRDALRSAVIHTALGLDVALQRPNGAKTVKMQTIRLRVYSSALLYGFMESSLKWPEFPFDVSFLDSFP